MARYVPSLRLNRRRYLRADDRPEIARVTALSVFIMLIAFFVALVAWTAPSEDKTVDLLGTLQATFKDPLTRPPQLREPAPVPDWMTASDDGVTSPLQQLQQYFPDSVNAEDGDWGSVEIRLSADRFKTLLLGRPELSQTLFKGFTVPRAAQNADDFLLQITIGMQGRTLRTADMLGAKIREDMIGMSIHPTRLIIGYENGTPDIVVRIVTAEQFGGVL